MDLNIGAALWLAAQAEGPVLIHRPSHSAVVSSTHPTSPAGQQPSPYSHPTQQQQSHGEAANGVLSPVEKGEPPSVRGQNGDHGQVRSSIEEGGRYRSRARVVLLGHGADELCAGYGRHRTRFRSHVRFNFASPVASQLS
jgi:hypothetical protein